MSLAGPIAWVHQSVHDNLLAHADAHAPYETGGLLLGYRHSPREVVITETIGPGPGAHHRRTGFDPDSDWQTVELARRYEASDRRVRYLGDWHTHPDGTTKLSRTDRRTLRAIAQHPDAYCPHPVMVVLGGGDPWMMCVRQPTPRPFRRMRLDSLAIRLYV